MRRKLALLALAGAMVVTLAACEEEPLLTEQVLFDVGAEDLTPQAQEQLAEIADEIQEAGASGTVALAGHADDQGDDAFNQALSERRAASVQAALTDLLAGTEVTFESEAFGSSEPAMPNDSEENRAQNRRVEIIYWA